MSHRPESLIGRAVAMLAESKPMAPREFKSRISSLCKDKEQARQLSNQLERLGYIERQVMVTDRAKARVGL
jgi:hypothetical protein